MIRSRRIDWRMLPLLGMLYSVALVDRINLAAARSAGMEYDLVCSSLFIDSGSPNLGTGTQRRRPI